MQNKWLFSSKTIASKRDAPVYSRRETHGQLPFTILFGRLFLILVKKEQPPKNMKHFLENRWYASEGSGYTINISIFASF